MAARSRPFTILLPPSEGKAPGGDGPAWTPMAGFFGPALAAARAEVLGALEAVGGGDGRLLGVGGRHLERAVGANTAATTGSAATLPAWQRYTGVVHDHLDVASMPPAVRRRAFDTVVVVSGLLGLVRLDDPVPDYRLKMGASLAPLGKLSTWWRPLLTAALHDAVPGRVVIDLLPQEHRAAWAPDAAVDVVTVRFVERSGQQRRTSGHDAKAAKGVLARHLLLRGGDPLVALASFDHERFVVEVG